MLEMLLVWGIILAPMTALRVFKFGPGEILLILWMILTFFKNNKFNNGVRFIINKIGKYQLANMVMMFVGMVFGLFLYDENVNINAGLVDFSSHLFMFLLVCSLLLYFHKKSVTEINYILNKIVTWGVVVYSFLLLYATYVSQSFLGIRLWMGQGYRFLGLALNPHQIGMITGSCLFFSLYLMSTKEKIKEKSYYLLVAFLWFWISRSLRSDTMTICYVVCFVFWSFFKVGKITKDRVKRQNNFIIIGLFLGIAGVVFSPILFNVLKGFIVEAGNGLGRIELWQSGLSQFIDKPACFFTGLGPGSHTGLYMILSGNEMEAHNTYVQLILNSGIFICLYYIATVLGIIKNPWYKNTYLVLAIVYFFMYGFGGNMNRRALVWFTYTICWILFLKTSGTEVSLK